MTRKRLRSYDPALTYIKSLSLLSLAMYSYITPDLIPQQQLQNKILRNKLAEMNQDGKLYRIKNGQIVAEGDVRSIVRMARRL